MRLRWVGLVAAGIVLVPAAIAVQAWDQSDMFEVAAEVSTPAQSQRRMQVTPTEAPPPKPYMWTGALPAGAPWGIPCNREQATVAALAMLAVGGDNNDIEKMLAVFGRESGCRYWVHNYNAATRDDSYSLCQLNAMAGHFGSNGIMSGWDRWAMLGSFSYAAKACAYMWSQCGFGPWIKPYGCSKP